MRYEAVEVEWYVEGGDDNKSRLVEGDSCPAISQAEASKATVDSDC